MRQGSGVLAGSVLTLDRAVRNFAAFTRSELPVSVRPGDTESGKTYGQLTIGGARSKRGARPILWPCPPLATSSRHSARDVLSFIRKDSG